LHLETEDSPPLLIDMTTSMTVTQLPDTCMIVGFWITFC